MSVAYYTRAAHTPGDEDGLHIGQYAMADFPPTRAGPLALLDHINHDSTDWKRWKTSHEELNHHE